MMTFIPDQNTQTIFLAEPFKTTVLVFPDSLPKIAGDAYVEHALEFVRDDINRRPLHFLHAERLLNLKFESKRYEVARMKRAILSRSLAMKVRWKRPEII